MTERSEPFAKNLARGLAGYGSQPFIEFEGTWYSGDDVAAYREHLDVALGEAGVDATEPIGVVVRNRIPHAAAILGFIATGRPVVMIYGYQSARSIAADVEALRLAAVVADREDWSAPVADAARRAGSAAIALSSVERRVELLSTRHQLDGPSRDPKLSEAGIHILTSGTTGPPKRVPIKTEVLEHTVRSITHGRLPSPVADSLLACAVPDSLLACAVPDSLLACAEDPPDVVFLPLGNIGGACQLFAGPYKGKRLVLLEKFTVADWVRAIKGYRIRRAGAQPAIVRMVLDADVPPEDLESLEYLVGGAGPLEQEVRDEFERRYGIPVLWAYGATEFAGSVCAWTPELYERYGKSKPDSAGKPLPGVQARVVDPDSGNEVPLGTKGFLQARVEVMGPEWIRTTDLASIDADGFISIHGRGDGAINRGGFKIIPETVRRVLIGHPAVRDAAVVGVPDRRLGEVPFAAIEVKRGVPVPTEVELKNLVREVLPSHHVPVAVTCVDELPRNAAMKVRPAEVAALYRPDETNQ